MKKKLLILTILFSGCLWAQETQVNLYGGYVFDDSFDSYFDANDYYEGKIEGGFQWGLGFEYLPSPRAGIELLYLRQDTNVPAVFLNGFLSEVERVNFDLGLNYLMLGGAHYLTSPDTPLEPFVGLMAGMVFGKLTNPENGNEENFTKFAWGLKAGFNYWASEQIGIKIQAQLLSAVQAAGGSIYFGPYGPSTGLNAYSTIYQFSFSGGLVYRFF